MNYLILMRDVLSLLQEKGEQQGFYSPFRQQVFIDAIVAIDTPGVIDKTEKAIKFLERRFIEQGLDKELKESIIIELFNHIEWKKRWTKNVMILADGEET